MSPSRFSRITTAARRMPRPLLMVILMALVLLVGWADHLSGGGWNLAVFYAAPVFLAVWWGDKEAGIAFAIVCVAVWCVANWADYPIKNQWSFVVSAFGRLFYFGITAVAGGALLAMQQADAERIAALEERRQLERDIVSVSEYEQQRIGQDLHDGLCQQLAAIGCAARALADDLHAKGLAEATDAEQIESSLQAAVIDARSLARGIFPVHVDRTGLSTALRELAETTSRMTNVPIDVAEWSEVHIDDPHVAMHLYRIAQEAVSNALKHSGADEIAISLTADGDTLELTITDNGIGVAKTLGRDGLGMGLRTMYYRAQELGAELQIIRRAEGGTSVVCCLKVKNALEAHDHFHT